MVSCIPAAGMYSAEVDIKWLFSCLYVCHKRSALPLKNSTLEPPAHNPRLTLLPAPRELRCAAATQRRQCFSETIKEARRVQDA